MIQSKIGKSSARQNNTHEEGKIFVADPNERSHNCGKHIHTRYEVVGQKKNFDPIKKKYYSKFYDGKRRAKYNFTNKGKYNRRKRNFISACVHQ